MYYRERAEVGRRNFIMNLRRATKASNREMAKFWIAVALWWRTEVMLWAREITSKYPDTDQPN